MSSLEVSREADATRERLARTLHQLRDQIAPQHLMNEMLDRVAGPQGSSVVGRMESVVRDHPLPVMLVGVGTALWLGSALHKPRPRAAAADTRSAAAHDAPVADVPAGLPAAEPAELSFKENLAGVGMSFADSAYQRIRADASAKLDEYAKLATDGIESASDQITRAFGHSLDSTMSNVTGLLQKRPFTFSIAALALGAALGLTQRAEKAKA